MKQSLLFGLLVILAGATLAHEFWLEPNKYFYTVRETASIRFQVGEGFQGENWTGNRSKINQLVHYTPSGEAIDLTPTLSEEKGDSLRLPLREEGTHMVAYQSKNAFISLEADKFNAYLAEDGLNPVIAFRRKQNQETSIGNEYYQRSVKTLLQVGKTISNACLKPTNLPLDIIPEENPYAVIPVLNAKQSVPNVRFKVLFKGKPMQNLLVKIWHTKVGNPVSMDTFRTNNRGWINAPRHSGPYMVSCVYMEPNKADTTAQWQSYWASLTFEYSQFFPKSRTK